MHVALLANTAWLDEELPVFQHLVVGLIDELVRVAQVVPESLAPSECSVFGERVPWGETRWRWLNHRRMSQLHGTLEDLGVTVIHALDGRMWRGALALSERLQVPAVLSANSRLDVPLAAQLGTKLDPARTLLTPTTTPLAEGLREAIGDKVEVQVLPQGVHVPAMETSCKIAEARAVVVSGNGLMDRYYDALLHALQRVVHSHPQVQFFFDGQGADQSLIWREAQRRGLAANLSMVPRRLGHREMLLRTDVLLHPQPQGRARGITLQAMARGLPVVAMADPWLDHLIDGTTCWTVTEPTSEGFLAPVQRCLEDMKAAADLGERAREWVRENRIASSQIRQTLHAYRSLTGEGIPIATGAVE
ncbi:glycosyltransferase [Mucisphaera sp.]|uniref:glycosyltransferase n=1 Tax=Mucisphaera sp. TaxID=2913024 RepID=UPI003D1367D3